ncbi:MAG: anti-sigma factor [Proteobacteria bacterium]|nr:anti-sigma factor [Pseudomonadota bacterium]
MNCHDCKNVLSDSIDGTLSESEKARVADHMASCPACSRIEKEMRQALSAARRLPEMPLPDGFMARLQERLDQEDEKHARSWFVFNRSFALRGAAFAAVACLAVMILVKTIDMPQTGNNIAQKAALRAARDAAPPAADRVMQAHEAEVATGGKSQPSLEKLKEADRQASAVPALQQAPAGGQKKEAREKRFAETAPAEMRADEEAQLSKTQSKAPAGVLKQQGAAGPAREWTGRTTGPSEPAPPVIIKDSAAWAALWKKHAGGQAPQIDFSKHMVIAVFQSLHSRGGGRVAISGITYEPARIVVAYSEKAQAGTKPAAPGLPSYHMQLIERSDLPVVFRKISQ